MELWNTKSLQPPPISCSKTALKEVDLKIASNTLKSAVIFFSNLQELSAEGALVSRIIYRMKTKFRAGKDFKAVEKVNRAILALLNFDVQKVLTKFYENIPQNFEPSEVYFPSRNMLDFLLVRLQGFGKLLHRILETCKEAGYWSNQKLRIGHFWQVVMIVIGSLSRIFVISTHMIKVTCDLYADLKPFTLKVCSSSQKWLPDGYELPDCLSEWLDIDWIDLEQTVIEIPSDDRDVAFFNLIEDSDDDDVQVTNEYIMINDESVLELTEEDSSDFLQQEKRRKAEEMEFLALNKVIDDNPVIDLIDTGVVEPGSTSINMQVKALRNENRESKITDSNSVVDLIDRNLIKPTSTNKNKQVRTPMNKKRKLEMIHNNSVMNCSNNNNKQVKSPKNKIIKTMESANFLNSCESLQCSTTSSNVSIKLNKSQKKKKKHANSQSSITIFESPVSHPNRTITPNTVKQKAKKGVTTQKHTTKNATAKRKKAKSAKKLSLQSSKLDGNAPSEQYIAVTPSTVKQKEKKDYTSQQQHSQRAVVKRNKHKSPKSPSLQSSRSNFDSPVHSKSFMSTPGSLKQKSKKKKSNVQQQIVQGSMKKQKLLNKMKRKRQQLKAKKNMQ